MSKSKSLRQQLDDAHQRIKELEQQIAAKQRPAAGTGAGGNSPASKPAMR